MTEGLSARIKQKARELGFEKVGISRAMALPEKQNHLEDWLKRGYQASMNWLERRPEERGNILAYFPEGRSVISVGLNYFTGYRQEDLKSRYHFSNYAWGDDYHRIMKSKLFQLLEWLKWEKPEVKGLVCVDTAPVMEKVWAQQAGLGWQGKHTNLITREFGSWVFLGELIIDKTLSYDQAFDQDLCGTCTACIDACPTQALTEYQLDAQKCISYLTIEFRGAFSESSPPLHDWIYGCDICQEVCPWNLKFSREASLKAFQPRPEILNWSNQDWEHLNEEGFRKLFHHSAVKRTKFEGLERNIRQNRSRHQGVGKES